MPCEPMLAHMRHSLVYANSAFRGDPSDEESALQQSEAMEHPSLDLLSSYHGANIKKERIRVKENSGRVFLLDHSSVEKPDISLRIQREISGFLQARTVNVE